MIKSTFSCLATGLLVLAAAAAASAQSDAGHEMPRTIPTPEDQPFAYRAYLDRTAAVPAAVDSADASELPSSLVIAPGRYRVFDKTYDLRKPGLYRFGSPLKENRQRIVYEENGGDVEPFLSGIAWIATHGSSDNAKSDVELTQKAAAGKLFVTCGRISRWAASLLGRQGVRARRVHSLTLDDWRSYDNGHSMIEVYRTDLKKWVLYDLDENACFMHRGTLLSLVEMSDRAAAGDYEIKPLAADSMLDVSQFRQDGYDLAFFMESVQSENGRRDWYKRTLQVPVIDDCLYLSGPADAGQARIEASVPLNKYTYLKRADFLKKFYGKDTHDANRDASSDGDDARRSRKSRKG